MRYSPSPFAAFVACLFLLAMSGIVPVLLEPYAGLANHAVCSDGLDNDGDGLIDVGQDPGCESIDDASEAGTASVSSVSTSASSQSSSQNSSFPQTFSTLVLSVTDGRERVSGGDGLIYAVRLDVLSPETVDVTLQLPPETEFVSAGNEATYSNGTVRWDDVTVQGTMTLIAQVNVRRDAAPGSSLIALATASGERASDVTLVRGSAGTQEQTSFRLSLNPSSPTAGPGETLSYLIAVRNDSDATRSATLTVSFPRSLIVASTPAGVQLRGDSLAWDATVFQPGEERLFSFSGRVQEQLRSFSPIIVHARIADVSATSTVSLRRATARTDASLSLSDGETEVQPGAILTYRIEVRNPNSITLSNLSVSATIPADTVLLEALNATPMGDRVRWSDLTVAANDSLNLRYRVRVRQNATPGVLRATAQLGSDRATDDTIVREAMAIETPPFPVTLPPWEPIDSAPIPPTVPPAMPMPDAPPPADAAPVPPLPPLAPVSSVSPPLPRSPAPMRYTLLKLSTNAGEVVPGGTVHATITVQNLLLNTMRDAKATLRFDPLIATVTETGGAVLSGSGELVHPLPTLLPGKTWQTRVTFTIHKNTRHGEVLTFTSSLIGNDVTDASLTERIVQTTVTVLDELPATGADPSAIPLLALLVPTLTSTWAHRRLVRRQS